MNNKKRVKAILLVATLLALMLVGGCGQTAPTDTEPLPSAAAQASPEVEGPSLISKEELDEGVEVGELI
ncbi:hypothetical protein ACFL0W_04435 [Nanoarchaeota archaeon]